MFRMLVTTAAIAGAMGATACAPRVDVPSGLSEDAKAGLGTIGCFTEGTFSRVTSVNDTGPTAKVTISDTTGSSTIFEFGPNSLGGGAELRSIGLYGGAMKMDPDNLAPGDREKLVQCGAEYGVTNIPG